MRYAVLACLFLVGCNQQPPKVEVEVEVVLDDAKVKRIVDEAVGRTAIEFSKTLRTALETEQKARRAQNDADAKQFSEASKIADLRQQAEIASFAAAEAKRRYESDIARAATLGPEEQARLRRISDKRKSGDALTKAELELAGRFHEFEDFVKQESERMLKSNGIAIPGR